jgi:hypothetical protein
VLQKPALALPSFAGTGGPFVGQRGKLVNAEQLDASERGALATLYCALQTDLLLDLLGAPTPVIIDGPLTENPLYGPLLATLRTSEQGDSKAQGGSKADVPVFAGDNRAGPTECARFLLGHSPATQLRRATPLDLPDLEAYRARWRAEATSKPPSTNPPR